MKQNVISKVLRLQHVIVALAGRADLPPIPAVDWNGMEIAKNALFEFYLIEQILQRDCSSAVCTFIAFVGFVDEARTKFASCCTS